MSEPGTANRAVGHRRWLMNPFATTMGTGLHGHRQRDDRDRAAALASRPNPAWVSWPTAGWFPDALEPAGRWSLSAGSTSHELRAPPRVRVYRDGQLVRAVRHAGRRTATRSPPWCGSCRPSTRPVRAPSRSRSAASGARHARKRYDPVLLRSGCSRRRAEPAPQVEGPRGLPAGRVVVEVQPHLGDVEGRVEVAAARRRPAPDGPRGGRGPPSRAGGRGTPARSPAGPAARRPPAARSR